MSGILEELHRKAKVAPKRILFPESHDDRVIQAAIKLKQQQLAEPVLISTPQSDCEGIESIECFDQRADAADWRERAAAEFAKIRAKKGVTLEQAREILQDPIMLAAVLVRLGFADAGVSGSIASTAQVLRAGIQGLGMESGSKLVSSFFLMELTDRHVLTYADCAVNPEPSSEQLAAIAIQTAASHEQLTGQTARVAFLSFSTKGSAEHSKVAKVRRALALTQVENPNLFVDGELQFDAAFVHQVAERKAPDSPVAGKANVFIFPDLDSGNIGYKITERLGCAKAVGPILQGMSKPWMDLSRGCSTEDIVDVAVIASVLAQEV